MITKTRFTLNGQPVTIEVEPRELLGHVLRERLGCRGVHVACGQGYCGACTVLLDGGAVRSCLMLALQADSRDVQTVVHLSDDARPHPLLAALKATGGVQCGYCTAGVVLATLSFLRGYPTPSRAETASALSGHLCRCTGYTAILDAVDLYVNDQAGTGVQP